MTDSSADRDPLERLADEFVARYRRGERPSLTEYANRLPDRADEVRDLFPALVEMEQLKPVTADNTGAFVRSAGPADPDRVGEFRILRRIAIGGMGAVYEAVQESLGRHVALKLLPIDALADPKRLERFRREAKAAAKLHHTNIVPVFGTGEADGRHFYAMQFIAGHPLDAVIDEVRRLKDQSAAPNGRPVSEVAAALATGTFAGTAESPPVATGGSSSQPASPSSLSVSDAGRYWATVARVGAQVADALAYAHAQGVLHRDIKPANLLLDLRGIVWVTDFGLAKANDTDDLTHAGDFVGTLRYMAPERFDGKGDGRADTYALGLTLYELLTLKPAFHADARAKLVEQVVAASPRPPRAVNPAIPRDLETIVLKATQPDPVLRYQSAAALADDLRRFVEDRPILARRASSAEQAWRWCRRNPAVASLVAAVLLVSVTGATVAALIAREQHKTAAALETTLGDLDASLTVVKQREGEAVAKQRELERQQEQTRHDLYAMRINQAQAALTAGRPFRTVEHLRETTPKPGEPDLRGWEWHYLKRELQPDRVVRFTHPKGENPLAEDDGSYSPGRGNKGTICSDGSRAALAWFVREEGGYVCTVVDTATGRTIGRLPRTGVFHVRFDEGRQYSLPSIDLSPDGRYALTGQTISVRSPVTGQARSNDRVISDPSLWKLTAVDTGEAIPLPAELARLFENEPGRTESTLGPGAAWLTVMTWKPTTPQSEEDFYSTSSLSIGSAEVVVSRWDRATNRVTTLPAFTVGKGTGAPHLTSVGQTVYWAPERRFFPRSNGQPPRDESLWFESWDVSGDRARPGAAPFQLDAASAPQGVLGNRRASFQWAVSPDRSKFAYINQANNQANQVVVHRVADGGLHARIVVPGVPAPTGTLFGPAAAQFDLRVNNKGDRVVVRLPTAIHITHQPAGGTPTSWQRPVADTLFLAGSSALSAYLVQLTADGQSLVVFDEAHGLYRTWDVTRDPAGYGTPTRTNEFEKRDGKTYARARSLDGRVWLDWPSDQDSPDESAFPLLGTQFGNATRIPRYDGSGPVVIRDAAGKVLGTLPDAEAGHSFFPVSLSGDGRRLFVRWTSPRGETSFTPLPGWRLYELGEAVRTIKQGNGSTIMPQALTGSEFLIEQRPYQVGPMSFRRNLPSSAFVVLYDTRTGGERLRIERPDRCVTFCGFDPTGRWYLYESVDRAAFPPTPRAYRTDILTAASALVGPPATVLGWRWSFGGSAERDPLETALPAVVGSVADTPVLRRLPPEKLWPVRIHLVDTTTGGEKTWDVAPDSFVGVVAHAQFSPDGRRILFRYDRVSDESRPDRSRSSRRTKDHLWVARLDGTVERELVLGKGTLASGFGQARSAGAGVVGSPDGRHVAVAGPEVVQVWDLDTGTLRHTLAGHTGYQRNGIALVYNADGSRLFTIEGNASGLTSTASKPQIHVWETAGGRELLTLDQGGTNGRGLTGASFADGKLVLNAMLIGRARVLDGTPETP
jgi:serine/threonine protein kinase